jgi:hypothetical protein
MGAPCIDGEVVDDQEQAAGQVLAGIEPDGLEQAAGGGIEARFGLARSILDNVGPRLGHELAQVDAAETEGRGSIRGRDA